MYIGARVHMFVSLHITMLTRKETGLNRNLPIFYNEQSEREREKLRALTNSNESMVFDVVFSFCMCVVCRFCYVLCVEY